MEKSKLATNLNPYVGKHKENLTGTVRSSSRDGGSGVMGGRGALDHVWGKAGLRGSDVLAKGLE